MTRSSFGRRGIWGAYGTAEDLRAAAEVSDVIYTDTWIDMEYFDNPAFAEEKNRRIKEFQRFQINRELLRGLENAGDALPAGPPGVRDRG